MQHARRPDRRLLRLISIVVPFLWLGAILVLSGLWPRLVPRQSAPPFDAIAASDARAWQGGPAARLGVNLEASELAGDRLNDTLTALDRDGYHWVRFTLPWDTIEPQPGQFAWAQWDAAFAALAEHPVLQPLVVLNRSPQWARPRRTPAIHWLRRRNGPLSGRLPPPSRNVTGRRSGTTRSGMSRTSRPTGAHVPSTRAITRGC